MSKPRVIELTQTCGACPSQWEGTTDDGREVYIRYRYGTLMAGIGATHDEAVAQACAFGNETPLYEREHGDEWDGYLEEDDMRRHLADVLDFDALTRRPPPGA